LNKLSDNALKIYEKLYFQKDEKTPTETHKRVAKTASLNDKKLETKIFNALEENAIRPNTPVMINLGVSENPQTSACFVGNLEDSLESIFDFDRQAGIIYSKGSGVGCNYGMLREVNGEITTGGYSSGPFSFMKKLASTAEAVKSGGKNRRAAHMAMFTDNHPNIEDFIEIKNGKDDSLRSMNLSIAATDKFMEAVKNNDDWDLIGVKDKKVKKTVKAKYLYDKICTQAHNNGDPGFWWIDKANEYNIFKKDKKIVATNPCFSSDTKIVTKNGAFSIIDLVGKNVEIYDGENWVNCDNFRKTGTNQKLLKITLSDGTYIKVTPYHNMYLHNDKKIKASELNIGDKLLHKDIQYNGSIKEDAAYLKGFMCAEGHVHKESQSSHLLIYKPKEKCIDRIKNSLNELPILSYNTNTITEINAVKVSKRSCFNLTGIAARDNGDLLNWCSVNKEKLPNEVFQWDYESKCNFLAGLFDGDGNVKNGKNGFGYQLNSINKNFLIDILNLLKSIGVYGKISLMKKACTKKMPGGVYDCKDCWRLTISQKYSIVLAKQIKFERLKDFSDKEIKINRNLYYNKIADIQEVNGLHDVYCCTVDTTHKLLISLNIIAGNCGEQSLLPYGACNLAHINLNNCIVNNKFDFDKLIYYTELLTEFCDNIIDISGYPTEEFRQTALNTRPIGIGFMGLADILSKLELPYSSIQARNLAFKIAKIITTNSIKKSCELAKNKKPFIWFENYKKETIDFCKKFIDDDNLLNDIKKYGIRNSNFTTLAPTGSTSISADCSQGMEPHFAICFKKHISDSDDIWYFVNKDFEKLYSNESWYERALIEISKNKGSCKNIFCIPEKVRSSFETAHDIHWTNRIDMQSSLQKYITNSISSTINLPSSSKVSEVKDIYMTAWEKGLKGITTYTDGSLKGQPIEFGDKKDDEKQECFIPEIYKKELLDLERSRRHRAAWKNSQLYINVSIDDDDMPIEVFTKLPKEAGFDNNKNYNPMLWMERNSNWSLITRLISMALRYGIGIEDIIKQCDKSSLSMVDAAGVLSRILKKYIKQEIDEVTNEIIGEKCPECGNMSYISEGGCKKCLECFYSKCG